LSVAPSAPAREDDALPPLPPLEGDDEPLGDAAGSVDVLDAEGALDDAPSHELALDVTFDDAAAADDDGAPLNLGADIEGIAVDEERGALDDTPFDERALRGLIDDVALIGPRDDRGEEGPLDDLQALAEAPPLDDDDDDDGPRREAPGRATIAPRSFDLTVDAAVDAAVVEGRAVVLASSIHGFDLAVSPPAERWRREAPHPRSCAVAVDGSGALYVATLEGAVLRAGADGAWREVAAPGAGVRALVGEGGRVWARGRDGAVLRLDDDGRFVRVPGVGRVTALAAAGGRLLAVDAAARAVLRVCEGGARWRELRAPAGAVVTRVAGRGAALAAVDGGRGAVWVSGNDGAAWTDAQVSDCRAAAVLRGEDGRDYALLACAAAASPNASVWRVLCDGGSGEAEHVIDLPRPTDERDVPSLELLASERAGAPCVALVDGLAYVVVGAARLRS